VFDYRTWGTGKIRAPDSTSSGLNRKRLQKIRRARSAGPSRAAATIIAWDNRKTWLGIFENQTWFDSQKCARADGQLPRAKDP